MRVILSILIAVAPIGAVAKTYPIGTPGINQLNKADSFTVECKQNGTDIIDQEHLDTEKREVSISIPGKEPEVLPIISSNVSYHLVPDRFGKMQMDVYVQYAFWAKRGNHNIGLLNTGTRWVSEHADGTVWFCAN